MPLQKDDVQETSRANPAGSSATGAPVHSPVFDAGSRKITHLVDRVQDVTALVRLRAISEEELRVNREQLISLRAMTHDLLQRQKRLTSIVQTLGAGAARERRRRR